jgi:hypothetical protein
MNATLSPARAENLSAPTTADTLQAAHDEIAILHGENHDYKETLAIAFDYLAQLTNRVEKLEKFL